MLVKCLELGPGEVPVQVLAEQREFDQIVEWFGMEQRPPVANKVTALLKLLGFATGNIGGRDGGRQRMSRVISGHRSRWFLEVGTHRATGNKQAGQDRPERDRAHLVQLFSAKFTHVMLL